MESLHGPDVLIRQPVSAGTVLFLVFLCILPQKPALGLGGSVMERHTPGTREALLLIPQTEKAKGSQFYFSFSNRVWLLRHLEGGPCFSSLRSAGLSCRGRGYS